MSESSVGRPDPGLWRMTREEASAFDGIVVVPVGATEQHGPHLPLGTDTWIVEEVAARAAARVAEFDVVRTPPIHFGYSHHHIPLGPTVSIGAGVLRQYLLEVCDSLASCGFERIFLLNGHGGNVDIVHAVAREFAVESELVVGAGSYWTIALPALHASGIPLPPVVPGHAGAFETSLMLALVPDLVAAERPERGQPDVVDSPDYRIEATRRRIGERGFTDDPRAASGELGARYLEVIAGAVADAFRGYWQASRSTVR